MRHKKVNTSSRPFVLIWEVTQACDLKCEHCRADAQPSRHPDELTTSEGKEFLKEVRDFSEGQLIVLSGGDPLKRDDIFDLVDYASDLGLRVTMTPSGTESLTPKSIRRLKNNGLRRMALSIDGATPKSHDSFRGEEGSFKQTIDAAKSTREAGLPLQINTTVCGDTVEELPDIRDLVTDLDAVLWSVFFLVPVGRGAMLNPITPERAEEVMEWLYEVNMDSEFGIKTTEAPHYRRVMLQEKRDNSPQDASSNDMGRTSGIIAGDGFAFVSHTGEVFPSGFLPLSAGNVRDESVLEIYRESDLFESLRDRDNLRGKCGACPFKRFCGGSRSRAYAYTGDPLESDPLCPYIPENYDGPLPVNNQTV